MLTSCSESQKPVLSNLVQSALLADIVADFIPADSKLARHLLTCHFLSPQIMSTKCCCLISLHKNRRVESRLVLAMEVLCNPVVPKGGRKKMGGGRNPLAGEVPIVTVLQLKGCTKTLL